MDLLALDRKALDVNLKLIATIDESQYDLRTPCDKWTIGQLLDHLKESTFGFAQLPNEGTYADAADAVTQTFGKPGYLDELMEFASFGQMPGRWKVASHLVDTVVHAWDLNKALGRPADLDEELAAAALKIAERLPDTPAVRGPDAAFHYPVETPNTATLTDRLVAVTGRKPNWDQPAKS
ncbi:TIGR03086 family protein [Lentzea sp. NBRC 105346]|uniref:TIGR03086 family metal-binding protein n=1 Tax=Lentzea sp. NBRC 105346 TaxID=3032205 RepID=UPI00249FFAE0|nr:TIGR03086 family metal-binding protein [Lentzea sp. NBRC 105346]GLZ32467.1 TIGR03086 family protein [Lentzea sp. NBRC 105346]